MNAAQIIARKREGEAHTAEEIRALVEGFVAGSVDEGQMAAWAMAVYWRGMTAEETVALTAAMLESGQTLAAADTALRVDKHSTGGIGDKTSLVIAPLLACCGLQVPMLSGRGLSPTGGTLDKLESIPGFRTNLARDEIQTILDRVGCVITGATADLVPADRKLYALREVTATVGSIPLIVASILSKKLAESLSALVIDVKFGSGAFMQSRPQARTLAQWLVSVAAKLGLPTTALLTAMDQPNGRMAGNAVEVDEALETLAGGGPPDLRELVLALSAEVLVMKARASDAVAARKLLSVQLDSGAALEKFRAMVAAQGGDLDAPRPRAASWTLQAPREGYVAAMDAARLGLAIVEMGGGRKSLGAAIDHSVGIEMLVRIGDRVQRGQPLVNVFASPQARAAALTLLEGSIAIGDRQPTTEPLVAEAVRVTAAATSSEASASQDLALPAAVNLAVREELVRQALAVRKLAYAPYSKFRVGAALLAESGQIYSGANVENASYSLTICAERAAIAAAVAAGETQFSMLAVATVGGHAPCGACRQFAAEFQGDLPVLLIDVDRPSKQIEWRLSELLPARFEHPLPAVDPDADAR